MDAEKRKRYEKISEEVVRLAGGRDNILGVAHCATRLRLVLEDNDKADIKAIEDVDLVKGVFVAGDQLQIIFGAGLVNDVCQVLAESIHMDSMSLGDLKTKANTRMNPLQRAVKALSDVFIEIMPGILAAALLTGLSSVLGNIEFVQNNDTALEADQIHTKAKNMQRCHFHGSLCCCIGVCQTRGQHNTAHDNTHYRPPAKPLHRTVSNTQR